VGKDQEAPGLDPAKNPASAATQVFDLLYSRLIRLDNQMRPYPDLAEHWGQPDPKTYIFNLRRGIKFHNGRELTADDIKYTYERILNPETGAIARSFFASIDTIQSLDRYTLKFTLKEPFSPFLVNTSSVWAGVVAKEIVEQNKGDLNRVDAGSGPFKLQEWSPGDRTVLVRNTDYYIPNQPFLDKITFQIMEDESARIAALRAKRIHLTVLTAPGLDTLKGDPNVKVESYPTLSYGYLGMNVAKKPFDNVKVRQAVNYAVDRKEIIDTVYRGHARLTGPIPSAMADWSIDVSRNPFYKADLNTARHLMAEAGLAAGFKTTIMAMATIPSQVESAQVIKSQLQKIGITAEIQPLEVGIYVSNWRQKAMELMVGGNNGGTNPDRAVAFFFSTKGSANVWNFSDAQIDDLAAKAATLGDHAAAKKLYADAQARIIELAPNLFLANPEGFVGYLPSVKNYRSMPDQTFQNLIETSLET